MGWLKDPHAVNRGLSRMLGYLGDAIPQYMQQKQANQRYETEQAAEQDRWQQGHDLRVAAGERAEGLSKLREEEQTARRAQERQENLMETLNYFAGQRDSRARRKRADEDLKVKRGYLRLAQEKPQKTGPSDAQLRLLAGDYRKREIGRLSTDIQTRMSEVNPGGYRDLLGTRTLPSNDPAVLGSLLGDDGDFKVMTKDNWGPWNEYGPDPTMSAKLDTLTAHYNRPTVDYLPMMRERAGGGYLSGASGDAMDQWGRSVYQDRWDGLTPDQKQTLYEGYNK